MELILNLPFNDRAVIKIIDRASRNRLVAIIYDEEIIDMVTRYLNQCPR